MRKITSLMALLFAFVVTAVAQSGGYPVNFDKDTDASRASDRPLRSVSITAAGAEKQTLTVNPAKVYNDLTTGTKFTCEPGATLKAEFDYGGVWMHGYVYLDADNDGEFSFDASQNDQTGKDLVSYSFYGTAGDASGFNSANKYINGDARSTLECPEFKAPEVAGEYRVRFKIDWNSVDAGGCVDANNHIVNNGGYVVDATLVVEGAVEPEPEPEVPGTPAELAETYNGKVSMEYFGSLYELNAQIVFGKDENGAAKEGYATLKIWETENFNVEVVECVPYEVTATTVMLKGVTVGAGDGSINTKNIDLTFVVNADGTLSCSEKVYGPTPDTAILQFDFGAGVFTPETGSVEPEEPEVPATPVVITEVSQLSNAKCYTLVSSDTGRGGMYALADKVDMCGVTYSAGSDDCHKVERNAADPKQQFAFVEYEGKHYLYSVSEKKFVMKSGNTNALVGEAPYEFVTVEKVGENTFALKANDTHYFTASPGWCANPSRGTCIQSTLTSQSESDGWDAGAWFTITEAGEFNPEEALAMLTPAAPATPLEFVKANPVLESEVTSLSSITLTFNKEIASVSTEPGMFWFIDSDMNMYDAEVQINATDAKTLTITLAEEIKEAGTYIAMFSQGALVAADGTSNETVVELAWTVKPEVVEPEPTELELVKANPALESEVTSLSSITLTFNKELASVTLNESTFFFMNADMVPVFGVQAQINATDAKSMTLTLPEEIKAEGEYVAMFMPSAIVAADGTSNQGIIELAWTVKAAPAVEPLKFVSIDPAAGSKLSSVAKFTLTFNKPVTLKNEEGATLHANGGSTTLQVLVSETDAKEVVLAADKEITNSGSYELKLAAGTLEDADGGLNEALTFNYEVESANNTLNVVKTDPDVNVPQESLKRVVLTFETEVYDYDSHATVNVTDESGAVVATGMMELDDYVWENVIISFNKEITTPGKYTVTVPENTIFGYGTYNPEINLTYTIGAEPTTGATLEPVSVDPAEPYWWDAMEDIEYIAINFPEEITYNAEKPVTVTFNAVENVEVTVAVSADDAKQLVVTFPKNLKIGEYVVNVPEGAVVAANGAYNPALTYTYNVDYAYNTFEPTSITPAAGKVESLKEIVLDFGPNDYPGTNGLDMDATFELTNAQGETVATGKLSYFGGYGAAITFDKEVTDLGLYTITIPEGVIWNSKVEGTSDRGVHKGARCNPTIELVYSIGEAATVTEVTPVPGHYEEIPSEISVTFSKEIGSVVYLILRNENTGMRGYYFAEDEYTVDGSKLSFTLPADMIKYAAGATVQMQVLDKDGFPVTYAASEDEMVEGFVMLEYTATAKSDLFVAKSVDPAEGEVEELSVLKVTFENLKATEGMSYVGGFDETKVVEVLDAEGNQVATAAMEVVNTVYREEWEGEVYEYESPSLVAQFTLNNTITEPGTYTFVIPEATVYNEGFYPEAEDLGVDWGAIYNPEVRYTYTIAGEAEVSYEPLHNGTKERTDRNITAVKLSSVLGDNEYSLTATEQSQDFVDATAVATFKVVAGEELTAEVKHAGEWVHHAVYVDLDANGFTGGIEEGSEWKPAGDLMAYAFYNNGGSSDEYGYNSVGTSLAGQDRHMPAIPAFKAPEQPGTYRMRFVQTWCSIDPAGDNDGKFGDFKSNGDQIVDVILEVTDATGIGAISVDGNNDVYSLDGRKVNVKMGKKLNKGIYIVNGKKVYVK